MDSSSSTGSASASSLAASTILALRAEALPPGLSGEEIYSRLFQEPEPTRPDYAWMNERKVSVSRKRLPPEYTAWLRRDGTEGNEARPVEIVL